MFKAPETCVRFVRPERSVACGITVMAGGFDAPGTVKVEGSAR
jgi:hypothetical protein